MAPSNCLLLLGLVLCLVFIAIDYSLSYNTACTAKAVAQSKNSNHCYSFQLHRIDNDCAANTRRFVTLIFTLDFVLIYPRMLHQTNVRTNNDRHDEEKRICM